MIWFGTTNFGLQSVTMIEFKFIISFCTRGYILENNDVL
jgi:hypothetical protein